MVFSGLIDPDIESGDVMSAVFCHDYRMYLYREIVVSRLGTSILDVTDCTEYFQSSL